jgi:hypothetical protein
MAYGPCTRKELEFGVGDGKKKEEAGVAFYQLPGW